MMQRVRLATGLATFVLSAASSCATVAGTPIAAVIPPSPPVLSSTVTSSTSTTVAPGPIPAIGPCELLPQAEAEELAGTPLDAPVLIDNGAVATCTYTGPVTGPVAQVEIFRGPGAQKYLDVERTLGHEEIPLDDIADEAYLITKTVFFRRGEEWVSIRLVRSEPAEDYVDQLLLAARTAAARM